MAQLNVTDFAKFAGVTRQAVQKAIRKGQLAKRKDGTLETRTKVNEYFIAEHNGGKIKHPTPGQFVDRNTKLRRTLAKKKQGKGKARPTAKPVAPAKKKSKGGNGGDPDSLPTVTKRHSLEEDKLKAQIRKLEVETAAVRNELLSRTLVQEILGQLSTIDRNEIITIGGQIAPELAGILGSNDADAIKAIAKSIEAKCYKAIQHKQDLITAFIKKITKDKAGKGN
jgi:hypothetical protein